jgi:hypothetical protein
MCHTWGEDGTAPEGNTGKGSWGEDGTEVEGITGEDGTSVEGIARCMPKRLHCSFEAVSELHANRCLAADVWSR